MIIFKETKLVTASSWAAVFLWLIFIFSLSAQPAAVSKDFSGKVTETIIETVAWVIHADIDAKRMNSLVTQFHHLIRKFAHGWIYFVLGVLVINTRIMGFKGFVFAMVFCFSYAVIDEIHQTFVSGRDGQISDVLIDTSGAILGIGACWVYNFLKVSNSNRSS